MLRLLLLLVLVILAMPSVAGSTEFRFKADFLDRLVSDVPGMLAGQDPKTGRFGQGVWIVNDQNVIYPLAVAWATKSEKNRYYHDPKLLEAIMAGGDALIADADEDGRWEFRKKDGSTWGKIYMPWTYTRWLRAFSLVRDAMPPDRRGKWERALIHGYAGIAANELRRVHNIPTHHAMGLYLAGELFNRPEWRDQAREFMAKVVAEQDPVGFWSEHHGPVVSYNRVYVDALGVYYGISHDKTVLPAMERASRFHASFTYPDGSLVETVDERNPYHGGIFLGNVGFSFSAEGRGFLVRQIRLLKETGKRASTEDAVRSLLYGGRVSTDDAASFLLYGEEGSAKPTAADSGDSAVITEDGNAMIRRKGSWFACLSAYCSPISESRWIQDRQKLMSIFHDRAGLIAGGGNTKLQPLWSTFSVGDTSLLRHIPGDQSPKFAPPPGLLHVPTTAKLAKSSPWDLDLDYGPEHCSVVVEPVDDHTLRIRLRATTVSGQAVEAHLPLIAHMGKPIKTERGPERVLDGSNLILTSAEAGNWIAHDRWRVSIPEGARMIWPALPHNPYVKDGAAKPHEGRIVLALPFSKERQEYVVTVSVD